MRTYTWEEYYEKFYDWAESTQVRNLSYLTSLGDADEVAEIIIELQINVPAANRLLRKAVEAKLAFRAYDLIEFLCINDKELATNAVYNSVERLTSEDMESLYGEVEDEVIIDICKKRNLTLPEDLREEEYDEEPEEDELEQDEELEEIDVFVDEAVYEKPKKLGFFGTLFATLVASSSDNHSRHAHNGRCNGDCANCPPHYGYRYGRWYYGKGHVHGCEFGGNKGDGGI